MNKRKTTKSFIEEANIIHNNFFDYSKTIYINAKTKVEIICPKHGIFQQTPNNHISKKHKCKKCTDSKNKISLSKGNNNFIKESIKIYGSNFSYNKMNYTNNKSEIILICKKHGDIITTPILHLKYKTGCVKCKDEELKENKTKNFIKDANLVHNNWYDYSKVIYINSKTKVDIICPKHGIFQQLMYSHIKGFGCKKCSGYKIDYITFLKKANIVHNNKYIYQQKNINNNTDTINIICPKHGKFNQTINNHLNGKGCYKCKSSKGELKIENILNKYKIEYEQQKIFNDLKFKKHLKFDFYLPNHNLCIEFDGKQHFKPIKFWGGEKKFIEQKYKDSLKEKYCINNNIKLLKIPYYEYSNIKNILLLNIF